MLAQAWGTPRVKEPAGAHEPAEGTVTKNSGRAECVPKEGTARPQGHHTEQGLKSHHCMEQPRAQRPHGPAWGSSETLQAGCWQGKVKPSLKPGGQARQLQAELHPATAPQAQGKQEQKFLEVCKLSIKHSLY